VRSGISPICVSQLGVEIEIDLLALIVFDDFFHLLLGGLLGTHPRRLLIFVDVGFVDELDAHLVDHHQKRIKLVG
jgi:hypothetical protein